MHRGNCGCWDRLGIDMATIDMHIWLKNLIYHKMKSISLKKYRLIDVNNKALEKVKKPLSWSNLKKTALTSQSNQFETKRIRWNGRFQNEIFNNTHTNAHTSKTITIIFCVCNLLHLYNVIISHRMQIKFGFYLALDIVVAVIFIVFFSVVFSE